MCQTNANPYAAPPSRLGQAQRIVWQLGLGLLLALALSLSLWLIQATQAQGSIIHVTPTGDPAQTGNSWASATTLTQALTLATAGDEIWVATGVYTPGVTVNNAFSLKPGVALYGGFAATETVRTERDWVANLTILSGDIGGDDIDPDGDGVLTTTTHIVGSNSTHVVLADGTTGTPITETTVLDGFTITAGQANGGFPDNLGGGFYCVGNGSGNECNPSLSHVTFIGNSAGLSGGAMFNNGVSNGNSSPVLNHVTFIGNSAGLSGGAMFNNGPASGNSSPILSNVTFSGNAASIRGGAIYNDGESNGNSSPVLSNVTFSGNAAQSGGAMYNNGPTNGNSSPVLSNVTFSGNAAQSGGAMYNDGRSSGSSSPSLSNVILWSNMATNQGHQLYSRDATPVLSYTLIQSGTNHVAGTGAYTVTYGPCILTSDPLFVNAVGPDNSTGTLDDDLRLSPFSPAIDAGDNSALSLLTDLAGNPRFYDDTGVADTGNGTAPIVDLGAYERQSNSLFQGMALLGNGQVILNGSASPSLANHTDFGSVVVGGGVMTRTFTIANNRGVGLTLTGTPPVALSGANLADFSVPSQPSSPVAAGNTATFQVRFSPSLTGTRVATLSIANSDPNENPYTFAISGIGTTTPIVPETIYLPLVVKDD